MKDETPKSALIRFARSLIRHNRKTRAESTRMMYQVETDAGVQESLCLSLGDAWATAWDIHHRMGCSVRICRYDRSGWTNYYELVATL